MSRKNTHVNVDGVYVRTCWMMGLAGAKSFGERGERSMGQWRAWARASMMHDAQNVWAQVRAVTGSVNGALTADGE